LGDDNKKEKSDDSIDAIAVPTRMSGDSYARRNSANISRALIRRVAEREVREYGADAFAVDEDTGKPRANLEALFATEQEYAMFTGYVNAVGAHLAKGDIDLSLSDTYLDSICESMKNSAKGFVLEVDTINEEMLNLIQRCEEFNEEQDAEQEQDAGYSKPSVVRGPRLWADPRTQSPKEPQRGKAIPAVYKRGGKKGTDD
jgi:hypothetical protein